MSENRRQHPRYAIELDAEIHSRELRIVGRTRDVSKGGFCMLTERPLVIGTACEVLLALVFSENQFSEQLRLQATIVWCTPMRGMFQVGLKFAPLDAENRKYLSLFMQFLEDGEHDDDPEDDFRGELDDDEAL
jgi:hypothetical protein